MLCLRAVRFPVTLPHAHPGRRCPDCGGGLVDVLLDWEDELRDYEQAVDLSNRLVVGVRFYPARAAQPPLHCRFRERSFVPECTAVRRGSNRGVCICGLRGSVDLRPRSDNTPVHPPRFACVVCVRPPRVLVTLVSLVCVV